MPPRRRAAARRAERLSIARAIQREEDDTNVFPVSFVVIVSYRIVSRGRPSCTTHLRLPENAANASNASSAAGASARAGDARAEASTATATREGGDTTTPETSTEQRLIQPCPTPCVAPAVLRQLPGRRRRAGADEHRRRHAGRRRRRPQPGRAGAARHRRRRHGREATQPNTTGAKKTSFVSLAPNFNVIVLIVLSNIILFASLTTNRDTWVYL